MHTRLGRPRLLALVAAIAAISLPALAERYTVVWLGTLGGSDGWAQKINDLGEAAGTARTASGAYHAFLWQGGALLDLGTMGYGASDGMSINNLTQVVGKAINLHPYLWQSGVMSALPWSPFVSDINDLGQMAGTSGTNACLYSGGVVTPLVTPGGFAKAQGEGINSRGDVCGYALMPQRPYWWPFGGGPVALPHLGGTYGAANAINAARQIAGTSRDPSGVYHAVLWHGGAMTDLGSLGGAVTIAFDLDSAGVVVGYGQPAGGGDYHAWIWDLAGGMRDLNPLVTNLGTDLLNTAYGINEKGQICGQGFHGGQYQGFVLTLDDFQAPTVSAAPSPLPNDDGWNSAAVMVSLVAEDEPGGSGVRSISLSLDAGAWKTIPGSTASMNIPGEGVHTLRYFATDRAGNASAEESLEVRIDQTPPECSATLSPEPSPSGWHLGAVGVGLAGTDNLSGVKRILYAVDGGESVSSEGSSSNFSVSGEGLHVVAFHAVDLAGNEQAEQSVSFQIDSVPPQTLATVSPPANAHGWNNAPVSLELAAADATSGVAEMAYRLDGGEWVALAGGAASAPISGDGVHVAEYRATDIAGNQEPVQSIEVRIDATPPSVGLAAFPNVLWPANGSMRNVLVLGQMTDLVSGIDPSTASYEVDDEYGLVEPSGSVTVLPGGYFILVVSLQASRDRNDPDGRVYTIRVNCADLAGNPASATAEVRVPRRP